jgi:glycosyltransferase involved in cell wall biosynthesis
VEQEAGSTHRSDIGLADKNELTMKLILITDRYAPEARAAAYQFRGLAEGFARRGHDVSVLTRYPTQYVPADDRRVLPAVETVNGVEIVRVAGWSGSSHPVLRGLDQVGVGLRIAWRLLRSRSPDAVLVSSPPLPLTLAAVLNKKLRGVPYVIHLHDLYPQTAVELGLLRNRCVIGVMQRMARAAYLNSGRIVAAAPATVDFLKGYPGLDERHVTCVDNFVDLNHCQPTGQGAAFREGLRMGNEFLILYAGLMGHAQDLNVIVECARRCGHRPDWRFVLAGDGARSEEVRTAASKLPNVQFLDCLPNDRYFVALQACDVALVTLKKEVQVPAVPGKVATIMASGRPFIAAVPEGNDTRRIASRSEGGFAINAGNPSELLEALDLLYRRPELRNEMGAAGRRFAQRHFSLEGALVEFERELRVVAERSHPTLGRDVARIIGPGL